MARPRCSRSESWVCGKLPRSASISRLFVVLSLTLAWHFVGHPNVIGLPILTTSGYSICTLHLSCVVCITLRAAHFLSFLLFLFSLYHSRELFGSSLRLQSEAKAGAQTSFSVTFSHSLFQEVSTWQVPLCELKLAVRKKGLVSWQ